jgi:hypothetical protein
MPRARPVPSFHRALCRLRAKVEVEELNELEVKTTFQLGATSNGIDPTREDVILRLGSLKITIAAGSFMVDEKARFRFEGVVDCISVEAHIRSLKARVVVIAVSASAAAGCGALPQASGKR